MKNIKFLLGTLILMGTIASCNNRKVEKEDWSIVIHGGAGGAWTTDENGVKVAVKMSEERQAGYLEHLAEAREIGTKMLNEGAEALDVVQAVVVYLEDCPLFNAGKGAVMTSDGIHELDAAIMDGKDLSAGAIAGVMDIKNPIKTARMIMEKSSHVFLIGAGASAFARENGAEMVPNSYFTTEARKVSYIPTPSTPNKTEESYMGTVGCVVLDKNGNLAAATSTGGMSGKRWGRVGDVPIIGAGTYANNNAVAVSGTGHGELWIRAVVAHDIYALMEYKDMTVEEAAKEVIWNKIDKMEGSGGGVICVDKNGKISMTFNTALMYRAWAKSSGDKGVAIY